MANALVTGASGFIGYHLSKLLVARGDTVTCLVRPTSNISRLRALGVRFAYGDVTDSDSLASAVAGKTHVYHLAGLTRALRYAELMRVNGEGCGNVARACAGQPVPPVLVSVSSLAAAGPALHDQPLTEGHPPAPVSNYGRSKLAGERALALFGNRVPITIVRPPIVYGEGDTATLPLFQMVTQWATHFVPGLCRPRYSVIHAADLAKLICLAAERGQRLPDTLDENWRRLPAAGSQGIYFAASERDVGCTELGTLIGEAVGRRHVAMLHVARPLLWVGGAWAELFARIRRQALMFSLDKVREATAGSWLCSPRAAVEQLGFRVAAPLTDRIRQTIDWYRHEGWL